MPRHAILSTVVIAVASLASAGSARARYQPLLKHEVEAAVKRRAKLYAQRRCRALDAKGFELWPGDPLRADALVHVKRYVDRGRLYVRFGQRRLLVSTRCLSTGPLGFRFRAGSPRALLDGIARQGPSLMERSVAASDAVERAKDAATRHAARHRAERLRKHFERLQRLLSRWRKRAAVVKRRGWKASSGALLRAVLASNTTSWAGKRGERYLTQFAGKLTPKLRQRLDVVLSSYSASWSFRSARSRAYNARWELSKKKKLAKRYRSAGKALRARLLSEDIGKLTQTIADAERAALEHRMKARNVLLTIGIQPE